eukprot:2778433-Pyramimonas_sp.AAC.1
MSVGIAAVMPSSRISSSTSLSTSAKIKAYKRSARGWPGNNDRCGRANVEAAAHVNHGAR